jgi:two-component system OmpR family response regulator
MTKVHSILIVDDHAEIRDALQTYLESNGFQTVAVGSAKAMDKVLVERKFDLVILDVRLPDEDGLSICKRLRTERAIPVLMLSALGDEADIIVGLELGADDYMVKPFNPREVLARIRAILRRAETQAQTYGGKLAGRRLKFGHLYLDVDKRQIISEEDEAFDLTSAEFQLMQAFIERPRVVLSRERLMDLTTGRTANAFDRAIDNQIMRLRKKIDSNSEHPPLILTVRGGGYLLASDVDEVHA